MFSNDNTRAPLVVLAPPLAGSCRSCRHGLTEGLSGHPSSFSLCLAFQLYELPLIPCKLRVMKTSLHRCTAIPWSPVAPYFRHFTRMLPEQLPEQRATDPTPQNIISDGITLAIGVGQAREQLHIVDNRRCRFPVSLPSSSLGYSKICATSLCW